MKNMIPLMLMLVIGAAQSAEPNQNPPPSTALAGYDK